MDGDTILDLPGSSTVAALAITVRDVNDEAPTFSSPSYSVNVNENIPVGSPLPNLDIFVQDTDAVRKLQLLTLIRLSAQCYIHPSSVFGRPVLSQADERQLCLFLSLSFYLNKHEVNASMSTKPQWA